MQAWVCNQLTGEQGLSLETQNSPICAAGQVKIKNHFAALNFPDVLITRGQYQMKLDPPFIPGSELAGVVMEVGAGIDDITVGQRVLAMPGYGAFAQEVVVTPPMQQVHIIPDNMSFEEAAAFNLVYGTAMHGLKQRGQLKAGETVLVLGAAGGCGSAAIQIAKAMGANVIAGASSDEKCRQAMILGADETINYSSEDLRGRITILTDGRGVDVVFDPVGDKLFRPALRSLDWNGRYLVIGFAGGDIPTVAVNYTLIKSVAVIGVAYGMSAIKNPVMNAENFEQLMAWYEAGKLKPLIGKTYPLDAMRDALIEMYAGKAIGKTVVAFN